MLKHKNIIDNLTEEQKIALLTDSYENLGSFDISKLPSLSMGELWEDNYHSFGDKEPVFPTPKGLANSWNNKLFGDVAKCLAGLGADMGHNLFVLPSTNASGSIYGKELSEEPYLTGALVSGAVDALAEAGVPYCMKAPVYTEEESRFLDEEANPSVLYDRCARPFTMALDESSCKAILIEKEPERESYERVNEKIIRDVVPKDMEQLCKISDGDMTTALLTQGKSVLGGSSLVISTALDNYKRIYRSMEEGGATATELKMTLRDGAAISPESIDLALDRKIELATVCNKSFKKPTSQEIEKQAYISYLESIVLLKNLNKSLPLKKEESLCLVGDIIDNNEEGRFKNLVPRLTQALNDKGLRCLGFASGYKLDQNISEDQIDEACKLADTAKTTCLFVGLGSAREDRLQKTAHLQLPANQQAIISHLRAHAKKLIIVVVGEGLPDMSFDGVADGVLLVPSQGIGGARAIADILSGTVNPSGRLAYAGYNSPDITFRQIQKRKRINEQKIGPYVCYRYSDSSGEVSKYPFGYGLSYTSFAYSKMVVNRGQISFTIRNSGDRGGYEVCQIYVGMHGSARLRPRKELKAIVRVYLEPNERSTINLTLNDLGIYDPSLGRFVTEDGRYYVYVASSASNVCLKEPIYVKGEILSKEKNTLSEYLHNVSNICHEGYTMEAYCKKMNNKSKLKIFGAILLVATLFADVAYFVSSKIMDIPFKDNLLLVGILNLVGLGIGAIAYLVGSSKQKKLRREQEKRELEATKELFKKAESVSARAIEELFEDEFDISLEQAKKKEEQSNEKDASTYTYMAVDTDIPTLCKELEEHFSEYGIKITTKMARRILSAVMTSRLLIVRNAQGIELDRILLILSRFFGTEPHLERMNGMALQRSSLLAPPSQATSTSALMQAIISCENEGDRPCFFGLSGCVLGDTGNMLMPFVQYFANPSIDHTVENENGDKIKLPSNLWFVVAPNKDESLDNLPAYIANIATLVDLEGQRCNESAVKPTRKHITCYQMDALIFRCKKDFVVSENAWKQIDAIEDFVNGKTPYHIGNKLFLQLEKYLAICSTAGAELREAIDYAVSSQLLPAIINLLKDNEGMKDTDLAQIIESFLGEEYATESRSVIKHLVMNRAQPTPQPRPVNPQPRPVNPQPRPATPQQGSATPQQRPVAPQPRPAQPEPEFERVPEPRATVEVLDNKEPASEELSDKRERAIESDFEFKINEVEETGDKNNV